MNVDPHPIGLGVADPEPALVDLRLHPRAPRLDGHARVGRHRLVARERNQGVGLDEERRWRHVLSRVGDPPSPESNRRRPGHSCRRMLSTETAEPPQRVVEAQEGPQRGQWAAPAHEGAN